MWQKEVFSSIAFSSGPGAKLPGARVIAPSDLYAIRGIRYRFWLLFYLILRLRVIELRLWFGDVWLWRCFAMIWFFGNLVLYRILCINYLQITLCFIVICRFVNMEFGSIHIMQIYLWFLFENYEINTIQIMIQSTSITLILTATHRLVLKSVFQNKQYYSSPTLHSETKATTLTLTNCC